MERQRERAKALVEAQRGQEERGVLAQSPAAQGELGLGLSVMSGLKWESEVELRSKKQQ